MESLKARLLGISLIMLIFGVISYSVTTVHAAEDVLSPRVPKDKMDAAKALKNPVPANPDSIATGKSLFLEKGTCMNCHGSMGAGDGPAAANFSNPPRDFTDAGWQKARTDGEIFWAITNGTEYGMIPFDGMLSETERWQLVNYVRELGKPIVVDKKFMDTHLAEARQIKNPIPADDESVDAGKAVYNGDGRCYVCHGTSGTGKGRNTIYFKSKEPKFVDLTDNQWQKTRTDGELFWLLREGPAYGILPYGAEGLSDKELWHVINYLREIGGMRSKTSE